MLQIVPTHLFSKIKTIKENKEFTHWSIFYTKCGLSKEHLPLLTEEFYSEVESFLVESPEFAIFKDSEKFEEKLEELEIKDLYIRCRHMFRALVSLGDFDTQKDALDTIFQLWPFSFAPMISNDIFQLGAYHGEELQDFLITIISPRKDFDYIQGGLDDIAAVNSVIRFLNDESPIKRSPEFIQKSYSTLLAIALDFGKYFHPENKFLALISLAASPLLDLNGCEVLISNWKDKNFQTYGFNKAEFIPFANLEMKAYFINSIQSTSVFQNTTNLNIQTVNVSSLCNDENFKTLWFGVKKISDTNNSTVSTFLPKLKNVENLSLYLKMLGIFISYEVALFGALGALLCPDSELGIFYFLKQLDLVIIDDELAKVICTPIIEKKLKSLLEKAGQEINDSIESFPLLFTHLLLEEKNISTIYNALNAFLVNIAGKHSDSDIDSALNSDIAQFSETYIELASIQKIYDIYELVGNEYIANLENKSLLADGFKRGHIFNLNIKIKLEKDNNIFTDFINAAKQIKLKKFDSLYLANFKDESIITATIRSIFPF